ncbi:MAG: hypothetical protein ACK4NX_03250 [Candidatus Paceibacteria bacterium]
MIHQIIAPLLGIVVVGLVVYYLLRETRKVAQKAAAQKDES